MRKQVIVLAHMTYQVSNQQHLRDLLEEQEGIKLSRILRVRSGRARNKRRRLHVK